MPNSGDLTSPQFDFLATLKAIAATAQPEFVAWMRLEYAAFQEGQAAGKLYVEQRIFDEARLSYFAELWVKNERAFCGRMMGKLGGK